MTSRKPEAPGAAVADRLHSAAIHLLRQLRKEDDASGLSAPRLSALSVVVFGGPLTLGQLAAAEQVKPPTMTRIVTGLEKDGLVQRIGDIRDRRLTRIQATATGQKVLAAGRARRIEKLAAAVRRLDRAELAELTRGVQLLEEIVGSMRHRVEVILRRKASTWHDDTGAHDDSAQIGSGSTSHRPPRGLRRRSVARPIDHRRTRRNQR